MKVDENNSTNFNYYNHEKFNQILFSSLLFSSLLFFSCANDDLIEEITPEVSALSEAVMSEKTDVVRSRSLAPATDSIIDLSSLIEPLPYSMENTSIGVFPESGPWPVVYTNRTRASADDELGLEGIVGMPVNIIVKQNASGRKYVSDVGLNKELKLETEWGNSNQKFYLRKIPNGSMVLGEYYLTAYENPHFLVSVGVWASEPDVPFLYVKDSTDTYGTGLFIRKGNLDATSFMISSPFARKSPFSPSYPPFLPPGSIVLKPYAGDNYTGRLTFSDAPTYGTTEFEIRPCDEFDLVEMQVSPNGTTSITDAPSFFVSGSYRNNGSIQQTMSTKITERAQKSSTFNRNTTLTTLVKTDMKMDLIVVESNLSISVGANQEWSYGEQETVADDREYNFPLVIAPYKRVDVSITVTRKRANIDYRARMRGQNTGFYIWEEGTWENIDCTDIIVNLDEYDIATGQKTRSKVLNGIPTTPVSMN
ncbi:MAG: hypothetical protein LBV38_04255 [Alistipes sp.]|nr:hypothetical protein [Alistipes sp.]